MSPASAIDINQESATRTMCKIPQELILLSRKTFEELASTQGGGMHITLGGLGDLFKRLGLSKEAEDRVRLEHHFREMDADGLGLVCLRDLLLFLAYNPDMVESMALAHAPKSLETKVKAAAVPARVQAAPAPTDADPDPSALAVVEGKVVEAVEVVLKAAPSAAEIEEAVHKAEHEAAVQVKMEALEVRARERLEEETREKEAIRHRARRDSELAPAPANGNGNGSHSCNGGGGADASVHEKAEALAARARAKEEEVPLHSPHPTSHPGFFFILATFAPLHDVEMRVLSRKHVPLYCFVRLTIARLLLTI